jgi:hypothetical protein
MAPAAPVLVIGLRRRRAALPRMAGVPNPVVQPHDLQSGPARGG